MKKLIRRLLQKPVEFECGRVRLTPLIHEAAKDFALTGQHYSIEMKDEAGLWHKVRGVKRFTFDVSADAPAEVYIEYHDFV